MKKVIDIVIILLAIIIAIYIGLFFYYEFKFKKVPAHREVVKEVIYKTDTIYLTKVKPKIYTKVIKDIDTLYLKEYISKELDTAMVAEVDTLTSDSLYLNIKYYFPPFNYFDIKYQLNVLKEKEIVYEKEKKYLFNVGVGGYIGTSGAGVGIYIGIPLYKF